MERFETWNVSTLRGVGKTEQLTMEMEPYRLSVLAVTETHLAGEDEMVLDECRGHKMLFSGTGREYRRIAEGVGLVLTPTSILLSASGRICRTNGTIICGSGICSYQSEQCRGQGAVLLRP